MSLNVDINRGLLDENAEAIVYAPWNSVSFFDSIITCNFFKMMLYVSPEYFVQTYEYNW